MARAEGEASYSLLRSPPQSRVFFFAGGARDGHLPPLLLQMRPRWPGRPMPILELFERHYTMVYAVVCEDSEKGAATGLGCQDSRLTVLFVLLREQEKQGRADGFVRL